MAPYYSGINPSFSGYNGTAPNQTLPKTGQMMKYQKPGAARSLFTPSIFGGTQQQKQKTPKQPYYGMTENVSYRRPEHQQLARAAEALGYAPSPEQVTPEMEQYLKFIEWLRGKR